LGIFWGDVVDIHKNFEVLGILGIWHQKANSIPKFGNKVRVFLGFSQEPSACQVQVHAEANERDV